MGDVLTRENYERYGDGVQRWLLDPPWVEWERDDIARFTGFQFFTRNWGLYLKLDFKEMLDCELEGVRVECLSHNEGGALTGPFALLWERIPEGVRPWVEGLVDKAQRLYDHRDEPFKHLPRLTAGMSGRHPF